MALVRKGLVVLVLAAVALAWLFWGRTRHKVATGSQTTAGSPSVKSGAGVAPGAGTPGEAVAKQFASPLTAARARISGKVTDPTRQPIAGAAVCALAESVELGDAETRTPSCTRTQADGAYELTNLYAASYKVSAAAPHFLPGKYRDPGSQWGTLRLVPGEERHDIDLVLRPGGVEVRGQVKDISGGVVAGASVSGATSVTMWSSLDAASAFTRSDDKGEFTLWLPPGEVRISAQAEGYAAGTKNGTAPGQRIVVLLTPESVLVGRVVEAGSTTPVPDALVTAGVDASNLQVMTMGGRGGGPTALTDADGRFRIERLEPGRYKPSAQASGRYGMARESVLLGLGATSSEIVIEVSPAADVAGRLMIDAHTGCAEGWVGLHEPRRAERRWARTDRAGNVVFKAVQPGVYAVRVGCEGYLSEDKYPDLVVTANPVSGLVWTVKAGLHIRGVVVDNDQVPVGDVGVFGQIADRGWNDVGAMGGSLTKSDGTFELRGLKPGVFLLRVQPAGQPAPKDPTRVELREGQSVDNVRIVLDRAGTIEGKVVDQDGKPVAAVTVSANGASWMMEASEATTGDDGSFTIRGLRAGDYRVAASRRWTDLRAPGTGDDDVQGVQTTVSAGQTATVTLTVERENGQIAGQVLGENGKPVPDAFVDAERESESATANAGQAKRMVRWGWARDPVLTDPEGRFTVTGLAPGSYVVHAYRKGGGEALAEHVKAGATIVLTIAQTGSIAGTVAAAGRAPDSFTIKVVDVEAGFARQESFRAGGGAWVMRDLPAGSFKVSADAPEGTAEALVPLARGQARDGLVLELAGRAVLRGQLVDLDTLQPVQGLLTQASVATGAGDYGRSFNPSPDKKDVSGADGRFEIANAPGGKVTIFMFPMNWETSAYGWTQIPALAQVGKETDLGPIRIARRRLPKPDDRGGDLGFDLKDPPAGSMQEDWQWLVAVIRPDGPAAASGLAVGDLIVSVDGHDVTRVNTYLYWTLAQVPQGTSIKLGTARGAVVTITAGRPL